MKLLVKAPERCVEVYQSKEKVSLKHSRIVSQAEHSPAGPQGGAVYVVVKLGWSVPFLKTSSCPKNARFLLHGRRSEEAVLHGFQ
jgi:hypothetical protein